MATIGAPRARSATPLLDRIFVGGCVAVYVTLIGCVAAAALHLGAL